MVIVAAFVFSRQRGKETQAMLDFCAEHRTLKYV
jgi:hypothetical protein